MDVDVQIYLSNLKQFFKNNPNDLMELIGNSNQDMFFELVEKQVLENQKGEDGLELTKKQIIDIVVGMKQDEMSDGKSIIVHEVFVQNKFGIFCLN